ncbi:MAG: ATP-dependent Clp protease ATP-binding subunit ClpX, partial [Actinobacteria bacterium]
QALVRGTGARGLRAILEDVLLETMYELPGQGNIAKVIVDLDAAKKISAPTLVPRTSQATRQRRAAS